MKTFAYALLTVFAGLTLGSCTEDNFDLTTEEELPYLPTIVEVENEVSYRIANSSTTNASAVAYKNPAPLPSGANYIVSSETVDVVCEDNGGFSSSFAGTEYFQFMFYSDNTSTYVISGDFTTEINGESVLASTTIVPSDCQGQNLQVEYTETENRLRGTFSGEFYKLADNIVSPFDSCVNYISLGVLEASFDVELIDCN